MQKIVYYVGEGCGACENFKPVVEEFCTENSLSLEICKITDMGDPNRFLIGNVMGVPITALVEDDTVLATVYGFQNRGKESLDVFKAYIS